MEEFDNIIIGAGITGITLARKLAERGETVLIIEKRTHIGGNCFDYIWPDQYSSNGVRYHAYGPHIFHTTKNEVIDFLSQFTDWNFHTHQVMALHKGELYHLPINSLTISQFFRIWAFRQDAAREILEDKRKPMPDEKIKTAEDVALAKLGPELYEAFIKNYTKKQWDMEPSELDRSVLERLPIRTTPDTAYFNPCFCGFPKEGYTKMFENMLNHPLIKVWFNKEFKKIKDLPEHNRLFVTSRIDEDFNFKHGKLPYRRVAFYPFISKEDPYPDAPAVVNFSDPENPNTRQTHYNKLLPENQYTDNYHVLMNELPCWKDLCGSVLGYPVPNDKNHELLAKYLELAKKEDNTFFLGRLGLYKYINMDDAVQEALDLVKELR